MSDGGIHEALRALKKTYGEVPSSPSNYQLGMIQALLDMGAKSISFHNGESIASVEFFPSIPKEDTSPQLPKGFGKSTAPGADDCRCGHAPWEHNGAGYCLAGCDKEKCLTPEAS